jgi:hypothetical protein
MQTYIAGESAAVEYTACTGDLVITAAQFIILWFDFLILHCDSADQCGNVCLPTRTRAHRTATVGRSEI